MKIKKIWVVYGHKLQRKNIMGLKPLLLLNEVRSVLITLSLSSGKVVLHQLLVSQIKLHLIIQGFAVKSLLEPVIKFHLLIALFMEQLVPILIKRAPSILLL